MPSIFLVSGCGCGIEGSLLTALKPATIELLSHCAEKGTPGGYPGHHLLPWPEPCLETSPLDPPLLPIFIGGSTVSSLCITSNPGEALGSI